MLNCHIAMSNYQYFKRAVYLGSILFIIGTIKGYSQSYFPKMTERSKVEIANSWKFSGTSNTLTGCESIHYNDNNWQNVSIPHTWNTKENDSLFSNCWYRVHFTVSNNNIGKQIYLYFEAVRNHATVYLNGKLLGKHTGGMTAFIFDATKAIKTGDNVLAVMVNNSDFTDCLPAGDAYITFGGIYRKAWIIITSKAHIDNTDFASGGVYISQTNVSHTSADVSIRNMLRNDDNAAKTFEVKNYICDKQNNIVKTLSGSISVPARSGTSLSLKGVVSNPVLWSPSNPYLYNVYTEISVAGKITDLTLEKTGFRYYKLSDNDFTLNGVSTLLRGANFHMENENKGTAFDKSDHETSWNMAKDLGFNFVRLAHYPRAQYEFELADSMGIMVWTENGNVAKFKNTVTPIKDNINKEFVRQSFNHPSIIFWGCGNEVSDSSLSNHYARVLAAEDATRPIVYASNGQKPTGCIIARNTYAGWYSGKPTGFPSGNHFISESGAGSCIASHQDYKATTFKIGSFEPEEYAQQVIEYKYEYLYHINPKDVPLFTLWQMKDASDPKFKGQNSKGLATNNYFKKDIYYFVRTYNPNIRTVHLCGKTWYVRFTGNAIKAYSNAASLSLTVNGKFIGYQENGNYTIPDGAIIHNVFYWEHCLQRGKNTVVVKDEKGNIDTGIIYYMGSAQDAPFDAKEYITNLTSSSDSAVFVNMPVQADWPVYYQCDGKADNTFKDIPNILKNAHWIATAKTNTNLSFNISAQLTNGAIVYYMTSGSTAPLGFKDTGITGRWRDNNLNRVNYRLFSRSYKAGDKVRIEGSFVDNVTLIVSNNSQR